MSNPITFWPQENPGIKYLRCQMPAKELGCDVRHVDTVRWLGKTYAEMNEGVAIWQIPCNGSRLNFIRAQMHAGIPVFGEVDDDYTKWDAAVANADWTPEMPNDNIQASVKLHRHAMSMMDGVICSTEPLADSYRELNDNVHVCRNSVDLDDWKERVPKNDTFTILWMASGSHKMDQKLVLPALQWAAEQPGVDVYLLGLSLPAGDSSKIKRISWIDGQQAYRDKMVELKPDIGICAIRDTPFSRGKSDVKVLEYSTVGGLPIVSPLPPYRDWLNKIPTAKNGAEWMEAIQWAVANKDEVRARADEMHEYVKENRTIKQEAQSWLNAVGPHLEELGE